MKDTLQAKLKKLPTTPGVYFHKSKDGEVIYVGKAAVLRSRVRQYFQKTQDMDTKTRALVSEIHDIDWMETESEIDALFLESEMVKRYKPRFNILLQDDKSQSFVRIDIKSRWPHVSFTRNPSDDGAEYFGPFYNGRALKKALRHLRKTFPYYIKPPNKHTRPSLDAHIGLEPNGLDSDEYKAELRKLISYLKGNRVRLVREMESEMKQAAANHDFEKASILRDRLQNLRELQRRIMFGDREFLSISKDRALIQLRDLLMLESAPAHIEGFDVSHISGQDVVASQVVFRNGVSSRSDYRKYKMTNQKNDDYANIHEVISRRLSARNLKNWGRPDLILIDGGKGQLASAIDAAKSLSEAVPIISLAKRYEEIYVHKKHSSVKTTQLKKYCLDPPPGVRVFEEGDYYVANLRSDQRKGGSHSRNLIGRRTKSAYEDLAMLLQRVRDESHRFAISYHTSLSRKRQTSSVLEEIPGVGPATRRKLVKEFGSIKGVRQASKQELELVVGKSRAESIHKALGSGD